jgi:hypothetical protein
MSKKLVCQIREVMRRELRGAWVREHAEYGVLDSTLRTWRDHMAEDQEWRLWDMDWGQSERIFSGEQALEMMEFIHENFVAPGRFLSDSDFKLLAT